VAREFSPAVARRAASACPPSFGANLQTLTIMYALETVPGAYICMRNRNVLHADEAAYRAPKASVI